MDRMETVRLGHTEAGQQVRVPLARPATPSWDVVGPRLEAILESGRLTNGPSVAELEARVCEMLNVRHCIAVSSCTSGLMLVLRAAEVAGEALVPSFTFTATAHAVRWSGLRPIFVDCDRDTLTLSPELIARTAGPRTSVVVATHVFGTPCDVDGLEAVARRLGLRVVYDAAHAFGSRSRARPIGGFGDAEVFSLTPTKPLIAGEGGLITTNDDLLAERCRIGRDYGNPGDYDCTFVGLNARMSEFHAAVALASLDTLEDRVITRNRGAAHYRAELSRVPGIRLPLVGTEDRSTFKDLTILIEEDAPTLRDLVARRLRARGIETRTYYAPPVHRQRAYTQDDSASSPWLPVTDEVCDRVLTLPLWDDMEPSTIDFVIGAVREAIDAGVRRAG